jgi:hypothetical protein
MRAADPMAMIKLERNSSCHCPSLQDFCSYYRNNFVLENIDDALRNIRSNRIVILTKTLRHLEITLDDSFTIRLFDVQSELEFIRLLDSIDDEDLADPDFCLIVQYDAVTGPIEQFQLAKFEVNQRFEKTKCRVAFVVHVDPRPINMHWVFSFGDGWDYCSVDEVLHSGPANQYRIPLRELIQSPGLSSCIENVPNESFKSLLLEMLGPDLQTRLASLRSFLGKFYGGMRTALGLPGNEHLLELLKGTKT